MSTYARWFHTWGKDGGELTAEPPPILAHAIRDVVANADPRFADVDVQRFSNELAAIRAEIFGVAWGHAFTAKDKHLTGEGLIAKEILERGGLWELGAKYNTAVATSTNKALPEGERRRRGAMGFQNSLRTEYAVRWSKGGVPGDVVARVVNRFFTQAAWNAGWTLRYLLIELVQGLGLVDEATAEPGLNQDAVVALQVPLLEIYRGSRDGISKVSIKAD